MGKNEIKTGLEALEVAGLEALDAKATTQTNGGGMISDAWWGWVRAVDVGHSGAVREYCFSGDTKLQLSSGEAVRMDDLGLALGVHSAEAKILRADGKLVRVSCASNLVTDAEHAPLVFVRTTDGRELSVTDNHPVVIAAPEGYRVVEAGELTGAEEMFVYRGRGLEWGRVEIARLERRECRGNVYNIALAGGDESREHLIVANGIVTGDLFLQIQARVLA